LDFLFENKVCPLQLKQYEFPPKKTKKKNMLLRVENHALLCLLHHPCCSVAKDGNKSNPVGEPKISTSS
jgi:hypothetical protein